MRIGPFVLAFVLLSTVSSAGQAEHKQVLLLYDEDEDLPGLAVLDQSLQSTLRAGLEGNVDFYTESMNLSQFRDEQYDRLPSHANMFDARQLERWSLDELQLPPGSIVKFQEPSLWALYGAYIVAALTVLLAQGALIAALLLERRRRLRAQANIADAEQRYRTLAEFTVDWEYWTRPDGTFVYISPSCRAITGYDAAEFISHPGLITEILWEEDRPKWADHQHRNPQDSAMPGLEVRIRTKEGQTRWLDLVVTPVTSLEGRSLGTRGSARDITAQKQTQEELQHALAEIRTLRDRLEIDNTYLREEVQRDSGLDGVMGASDVMEYVVSKVKQVAPTPSSVLLLGETGVGKSLVARAIHSLSARSARPLVTLDCAALPPGLVESELFGHEKGAFTGAHTRRIGRFEVANGGTLFLDEIGELPLEVQGKLLRAVQDGEFARVGSNESLKTDVRLIVATNRQLGEEVRAGRFRQDLWYRLNVFPITLPPLRQRTEDLPLLVHDFVEKHCRKLGRPTLDVSKATMIALQSHSWPGNVRELENVIERAVIVSRGPRVEISDDDVRATDFTPWPSATPGIVAHSTLEELERAHILATLEVLNWRVEGSGGAADVLGINASTLRSRMRKLGIRRPGSSPPAELAH